MPRAENNDGSRKSIRYEPGTIIHTGTTVNQHRNTREDEMKAISGQVPLPIRGGSEENPEWLVKARERRREKLFRDLR